MLEQLCYGLGVITIVLLGLQCTKFLSYCNSTLKYRKQWKGILLQLIAIIIHFYTFIILLKLIARVCYLKDISVFQIYPSLLVLFIVYISLQSKFWEITLASCFFLFTHIDFFFFAAKFLPGDPILCYQGNRFFYLQNSMLFLVKLELLCIYLALSGVNDIYASMNNRDFILCLLSIAIFIAQQYIAYFKSYSLEISTFKQLKNLVKQDIKGENYQLLKNVKHIYMNFLLDREDIHQQSKTLIQAFLYHFNDCQLFSPYIKRVGHNGDDSFQIVDLMVEYYIGLSQNDFIKSIQDKRLAIMIQEINIDVYQQQDTLNQIASKFASSANFININPYTQEQGEYFKIYQQAVKEIESTKLTTILFNKQFSEILIYYPKRMIYDLYQ